MFRKLVRLVAIAALGCIFSVSISTAIFFATRAVRPSCDFLKQHYIYVIVALFAIATASYIRRKYNEARFRNQRLQWEVEHATATADGLESVRFSRVSSARASIAPEEKSVKKEIIEIFVEAAQVLVFCIAILTPLISIVLYIFFGVPTRVATLSSTIACFIISVFTTFACNNWFNSVGEKASFVIAATCLSPTIIPLFPQLNYFSLW